MFGAKKGTFADRARAALGSKKSDEMKKGAGKPGCAKGKRKGKK